VQLYADFAIPNHTQWFLKTFGGKEGPSLEAKYSQNLEGSTIHWRGLLTHWQAQGKTEVVVEAFAKPEEAPPGLVKTFGSAMIVPASIYHAVATNGAKDPPEWPARRSRHRSGRDLRTQAIAAEVASSKAEERAGLAPLECPALSVYSSACCPFMG
jgi:hypothetical protein